MNYTLEHSYRFLSKSVIAVYTIDFDAMTLSTVSDKNMIKKINFELRINLNQFEYFDHVVTNQWCALFKPTDASYHQLWDHYRTWSLIKAMEET